MPGRLTTHVLDTSRGKPAEGMTVEVWRIFPPNERVLLKTVQTNADGRIDGPLVGEEEMQAGVYELVFWVGDYFSAQGVEVASPPFLDRVPVRFGIAEERGHYHVPLLVSPWAYSTYRGS